MPLFLITYWKQLLLTALISLGVILGYSYVKNIGYQEAVVVYEAKELARENALAEHIKTLEGVSSDLVKSNSDHVTKVDTDIKSIIATVKGKSPYVIVDGKCAPSADFNAAYEKIIRKANE